MKPLNVLVTGANGFVGSHILEALMQRENIMPIAACRNKCKLIPAFTGEVREGDLRDRTYLDSLLDGIDVICHAAAWTSAWDYNRESERLFLQPTVSLVDQALQRGISRFIFLSSDSVAAPYARLCTQHGTA